MILTQFFNPFPIIVNKFYKYRFTIILVMLNLNKDSSEYFGGDFVLTKVTWKNINLSYLIKRKKIVIQWRILWNKFKTSDFTYLLNELNNCISHTPNGNEIWSVLLKHWIVLKIIMN